MKEQGTDGLSRGDLTEGVMRGENIMSFIPLHKTAVDKEPILRTWINSWYQSNGTNWISPDQWYTDGQMLNHCIWTPPPAAADAAIELLAKSKHKRLNHEHVVLIPRLMTSRWRRMLGKVCDVVVTIPVGSDIWGYSQHEPLLLGIAFSFIKHRPWRLRNTKLMERAESDLRAMPPTSPEWGRSILFKLCSQARALDQLPESLVWTMLQGDASN
jgi:hypothetical protein